jgi:capsular polysaccharide biosynthesis protein
LNLYEFVRLVVRRWRFVAGFTALGLALAIVLAFVTTKTYLVQTTLFVSSTGATIGDRLQNAEYTKDRVSSYADLATSPAVVGVVRSNLGLSEPEAVIAGKIDAQNPLDTALIEIAVEDSSPEQAMAIAAEIDKVMGPVVGDLEGSELVSAPVKISVVRPPALPTAPVSPNKKLYVLLGLALGSGLGIVTARLRDAWEAGAFHEHMKHERFSKELAEGRLVMAPVDEREAGRGRAIR